MLRRPPDCPRGQQSQVGPVPKDSPEVVRCGFRSGLCSCRLSGTVRSLPDRNDFTARLAWAVRAWPSLSHSFMFRGFDARPRGASLVLEGRPPRGPAHSWDSEQLALSAPHTSFTGLRHAGSLRSSPAHPGPGPGHPGHSEVPQLARPHQAPLTRQFPPTIKLSPQFPLLPLPRDPPWGCPRGAPVLWPAPFFWDL